MTRKEIEKIFSSLKDDDRENLINAFIRWWTYGIRDLYKLDLNNSLVNFDIVSVGIAVVKTIPVLNSDNERICVQILPYKIWLNLYVFESDFIRAYYRCNNTDEILSQIKQYGKKLTYPEYFKSKEELLEG